MTRVRSSSVGPRLLRASACAVALVTFHVACSDTPATDTAGQNAAAVGGSTPVAGMVASPAGSRAAAAVGGSSAAAAGRAGSGVVTGTAGVSGSSSANAARAGSGGTAGTSAGIGGGVAAANGGSGGSASAGTGGATNAGAAAVGALPTDCQKGIVKASEVVFIGESFIAQTGAIPRLTTQLARDAKTIGASESYRSTAVSGTQLTTGEIPMQYDKAKAAGPIKVILMDGGGNDLLFGGDNRCKGTYDAGCAEVVAVVTKLFTQMKTDGVKDVVYFFYPDPMGIGADIKAAMDVLRPEMQKACEGSSDVRCVWVDQRESWEGHYDTFTSDGIHPTEAGAMASSKQIWDAMVASCIAQ